MSRERDDTLRFRASDDEPLDQLSPEALIAKARAATGSDGDVYLDQLYRRFHPKVAGWCLSICSDPDLASDLAQEVLMRVHTRLDSFRLESRFATWIYRVTRNVALNRLDSLRRRPTEPLEDGFLEGLESFEPSVEKQAEASQISGRLRKAIHNELNPVETRVLYLHYVAGLSLPAIGRLLGLSNRSGAKAYVVSAKRKLKRSSGEWLARPQPDLTMRKSE